MEMHGADALYSLVKSLMHGIWTEDEEAQHHAAHRMIQISKPWMIRRWSESKLANRKPPVKILKENAHRVDLQLTEEEQVTQNTVFERYTSQVAAGAWRVHRWWLACFSLVLGVTDDWNDVSGRWENPWPLDTWAHCPIFR
jgi:hypothetical protein